MHRILALSFALVLVGGCSTASSSPDTQSPTTEDVGTAAPAGETTGEVAPEAAPKEPTPETVGTEAIPEGSKVVCHLACSGTESKAYGVTEEEARAKVRGFVEEKCKPEDGQHFIFCDPVDAGR